MKKLKFLLSGMLVLSVFIMPYLVISNIDKLGDFESILASIGIMCYLVLASVGITILEEKDNEEIHRGNNDGR